MESHGDVVEPAVQGRSTFANASKSARIPLASLDSNYFEYRLNSFRLLLLLCNLQIILATVRRRRQCHLTCLVRLIVRVGHWQVVPTCDAENLLWHQLASNVISVHCLWSTQWRHLAVLFVLLDSVSPSVAAASQQRAPQPRLLLHTLSVPARIGPKLDQITDINTVRRSHGRFGICLIVLN